MKNEKLHKVLLDIQENLKAPKNQYNDFGKYKYRSTEDIVNGLKSFLKTHSCTIILSDEIVLVGDRVYVKATATLCNGENEISVTAYAREPQTQKGMNEAQITGSASTYARKYALNGLFAIDDTKDADTMDNSSSGANGLISENKHTELRKLLQDKKLDYMTVCANWNLKSLSELRTDSLVNFKTWVNEQ